MCIKIKYQEYSRKLSSRYLLPTTGEGRTPLNAFWYWSQGKYNVVKNWTECFTHKEINKITFVVGVDPCLARGPSQQLAQGHWPTHMPLVLQNERPCPLTTGLAVGIVIWNTCFMKTKSTHWIWNRRYF